MSVKDAKYVWVELEPVFGGVAGLHTKQEQELTENVKSEVKSEPVENMCVISETARADLYLNQEQPESAQAGHIDHAVEAEVKAEPKDMSDSEPATQASLYSHIDPAVKAALKAEAENMCGDNEASMLTDFEYESANTSQIDHLVKDTEPESEESVCSMSTVSEQAELYLKHEVQDGLVVGPEAYHRASFNLAMMTPIPQSSCTVRLERMHVDMERCLCSIGGNTYRFQLCLIQQENDTTADEEYSPRSEEDGDEELYRCQSCDFTSVHKHYIRVHKNIAHANEKMWKHKQRKNSQKKPYQCDQCKFATLREDILQCHKKMHTKNIPYKCDECDFATNIEFYLQVHKKTHIGEKPYNCDKCDYAHARKYELEVHVNTVHGSEKVYKCDQCKFATVREDIFHSHKKMHANYIPYKCEQCDFTTKIKENLQVHKTMHIVEKPYKCDQCYYDGASETLLEIHKNMMHGAFAQISNGKKRKTRRRQKI
ncbi:zinc finger protein 90-like [Cydia pomonella]|uniref:zinc finger protein 90-like n=1 Tax=Cydia pomonella TaxID=82600 RepID=UPI002ADD418F|nr:zinc finger protein 90-like [Cydia pomonella]